MLAAGGAVEFVHHGVVNEVRAAGERGEKPAAARDGGKGVEIVTGVAERSGDQAGAEIRLRQGGLAAELVQFVVAVQDGGPPFGSGWQKDTELGGCRSRINDQHAAA